MNEGDKVLKHIDIPGESGAQESEVVPVVKPAILETDASYSLSSEEFIRKYAIDLTHGETQFTEDPRINAKGTYSGLVDLNMLEQYALNKDIRPESIILDTYTGLEHTAFQLLGVTAFGSANRLF